MSHNHRMTKLLTQKCTPLMTLRWDPRIPRIPRKELKHLLTEIFNQARKTILGFAKLERQLGCGSCGLPAGEGIGDRAVWLANAAPGDSWYECCETSGGKKCLCECKMVGNTKICTPLPGCKDCSAVIAPTGASAGLFASNLDPVPLNRELRDGRVSNRPRKHKRLVGARN